MALHTFIVASFARCINTDRANLEVSTAQIQYIPVLLLQVFVPVEETKFIGLVICDIPKSGMISTPQKPVNPLNISIEPTYICSHI